MAHNAPPFCKYYRMQPRQHYASEWIFFIMFSSICLVDFLLHRVWIILHWNVDQHLGYSGLITLPEVSNHFKHIHPRLLNAMITVPLTYSLFHWLPYSKYTCTSVVVVRLLRWNGRLLGEHWGLPYDSSVLWRSQYGYLTHGSVLYIISHLSNCEQNYSTEHNFCLHL